VLLRELAIEAVELVEARRERGHHVTPRTRRLSAIDVFA
jgi:hypothetical protein